MMVLLKRILITQSPHECRIEEIALDKESIKAITEGSNFPNQVAEGLGLSQAVSLVTVLLGNKTEQMYVIGSPREIMSSPVVESQPKKKTRVVLHG